MFIGSNSTILGGANIGSNMIIGAGSLMSKDVPSDSVVVWCQLSIFARLKTL